MSKTFNEPVHHCADQAWLQRYQGARTTHERLSDNLSRVKAVCSTHEQGLFEIGCRDIPRQAVAGFGAPKPSVRRETPQKIELMP